MSSALDFLDGLVPHEEANNPDEAVGSSSSFANAEEFVRDYGEDFIREIKIIDARKRYKPSFNNDSAQYDGDDEPTVTIVMVDSEKVEFLYDTTPANRTQMIGIMELGKPKDVQWTELMDAVIGQIFIIQPRFYAGLKKWGFVFSKQRTIARIVEQAPAQQQKNSNRQAPTRR